MKNIYEHSFLYVIATAISNFIMKMWKVSLIRHIFYSDFLIARNLEQSKLLQLVNTLIAKSQGIFMPMIKNSGLHNLLTDFFESLVFGPLSNYAPALLFFGLAGQVASESIVGHIIYFIIMVFAALLFIIKISLADLYNGSWIAKQIGSYLGFAPIPNPELQAKNHNTMIIKILYAVIGICIGALSVTLSLMDFIMVVGGLGAAFLVLFKLEIGIYTAIFLLPILPSRFIMPLCLLCIISYFMKVMFTGKEKFSFSLTDFFALLFMILIIYSVIISVSPANSLFMAASYVLYICFYFVVKNSIKTKEQLFSIISLILLSGFLVSLFGIIQRLTGFGFEMTAAWIDTEMFEAIDVRVYSTLENPNLLGAYLLFIIPLALAGLYYFENYVHKLFALAALGASTLCMIFTFSRGAWLGLVLTAIIFTLMKDRRLIWLGIFIVVVAPVLIPEAIINRFISIGDLGDTSTHFRMSIWLASLEMFRYFWPIGIGLGTDVFISIYQRFAFAAVYAPHSHNIFLQIAIELGIWGLLLFLSILVVFFKNMLTQVNNTKSSFYTAVCAALCAGMAGYLLQGITDHVWYNYRVFAFFWVLIALSGVLNKFMKEDSVNVQV